MPMRPPVVVHPPSPTGGRHVRVDGRILGLAYGLADLADLLRQAGLELSEYEAARSDMIEWRGGGPYVWVAPR